MSYDPTIPKATDRPSASQNAMLINFGQLNTQIGTEHTALNAGAGNGKHKYVTLVQSPAVPAPVGNDVVLTQEVAFSHQYLKTKNSGGSSRYIPQIKNQFTAINIPGSQTVNLIDFSTIEIDHTSGTILVYDQGDPSRSIFTTFFYTPGTLSIPGVSPDYNGQLRSGTTTYLFKYLEAVGSMLRLKINAAYNNTISVIITMSPS
jgi:hypothetical protein